MNAQLVPLSEAVAPSRATHRRLIGEVRSWALARGTPVDADLLALHLAIVDDDRFREDHPVTHWTRPLVNAHLMYRSFNWCSTQRMLLPEEGFCETLWELLDFLDETGRLDAGSDALEHLREPLVCYGWLGPDGRRRPDDEATPFECACFFPVGTPMSVVRAARRGA